MKKQTPWSGRVGGHGAAATALLPRVDVEKRKNQDKKPNNQREIVVNQLRFFKSAKKQTNQSRDVINIKMLEGRQHNGFLTRERERERD